MQEMIEIKRTWFGKKVARATLPVAEFTEQMVYRLRDQLADFVSGMNEADLATMETKSWRHFVCRDTFLNVDQVSTHAPLLILPETHFWIIDEDHMRVWIDEEVFRDFIRKFYPGTIDEAEIGVGLNNAYDDSFDSEGDFQLSFNSMTLVIERREVPEKVKAEPISVSGDDLVSLPSEIESDKLNTAINVVKKEYLLKREHPTSEVLAKIRETVIAAALDYRQTELIVKAEHTVNDDLKTRRTIRVSHAGHEESFEAEITYSNDSIVIDFPKGFKEGAQFDRLIEADGRTPSGIDQHAHADCKRMVMRKYFPNDAFACEIGRFSCTAQLQTTWIITLVAIKGKNNEQV